MQRSISDCNHLPQKNRSINMIDNKEIQIGHYVKDRKGRVIKIDFIEYLENGYSTKFGMYQEEKDSEWFGMHPLTEYTDFAEPIEISGHWLIALGFEELEADSESEYYYYSKHLGSDYYVDVAYNPFDWIFSLRSVSNVMPNEVYYLPNKIKYVHQFQTFLNCL